MSSLRMLGHDEESDDSTEVTWEDQQRINTFSKLNTRHRNLQSKLDKLKQEKEALDDLSTELELSDEGETILYKVGETFLHLPLPRALRRLEKDLVAVTSEITSLSDRAGDCVTQMNELKAMLYAKFGRAINLDE